MYNCKLTASFAFLAITCLVSSAWAQIAVIGTNQVGSVPFTPTWVRASGNLIAGLVPTVASGNFGEYTGGLASIWWTSVGGDAWPMYKIKRSEN